MRSASAVIPALIVVLAAGRVDSTGPIVDSDELWWPLVKELRVDNRDLLLHEYRFGERIGMRTETLEPKTAALDDRVDAVFADIDTDSGPGCALGVMEAGTPLALRGYGMANLEYGVPITPSSVFHIASTSKQFTAMAVALLVRDGAVSWDDDVRQYVPEVPDFGEPVTLRHLVHHTSGLRDQWELLIMAGWRWEADLVTQADVLDVLGRQRAANFAPGREMLYSNTGFTLLTAVVERVSGQSLREFADERIFEPLGMQATHFHDDHQMIVPARAYGYSRNAAGELTSSNPDFAIVGATSLFTTVEDLARWDGNFYEPKVGGPAAIADLTERGVLADGEVLDFAKGLIHSTQHGLPMISHGGGDAGYRAQLLRFPEQRLAVAVLCNHSWADPNARALRVAKIYLEELHPDALAAVAPGSEAGGGADPGTERDAGLAGYYLRPESDIGLSIVLHEGELRLRSPDGPLLARVAPLRFRIGDGPDTAAFEPGADGEVRIRLSNVGALPGRTGEGLRANPPRDPKTWAELAGDYWSQELGALYRVEVDEAGVRIWNRRHGTMTLTPLYEDGFRFYLGAFAIAFTRAADGSVTGLTMSSPRVRKVSFDRVGPGDPIPYFANRFNPTDAERLARYSSLLVNARRFELDGGLLTIHPEFALVPEFVGGVGEFEYSLDGGTLQLVWRKIESADGTPDPNTAAGVRDVTRWQRIPGVPSP